MIEEEIEQLERTAAWRLRLLDANPGDTPSAAAAERLEALAHDIKHNDYSALWTELQSILNWLGESDAISDFADQASAYRQRIGISENPTTGLDYLLAMLAIARGLV